MEPRHQPGRAAVLTVTREPVSACLAGEAFADSFQRLDSIGRQMIDATITPVEGKASRRTRSNALALSALLLILISAAAVRVACAGVLTFDELWHLALTKGAGSPLGAFPAGRVFHQQVSQTSLENAQSILHVWLGMREVLHPPLYVVTLRIWRQVIGESDFAAQTLSIVFSLVAIIFTYLSGALAMNRRMGLIVAATIAFSQTQVYFAQEVRSYAMLTAIGSVGLWVLTRVELLGPTRRRAIVLGILSFLILLTHYFGAGAVLAVSIYGGTRMKEHRRAFVGVMISAAALYALIWLPSAIAQLKLLGTGDALLYRPDVSTLERFASFAGVPFRLLAERDYQIERMPLLSSALFILPWFLIRRFRPLAPWAMWLCLSVMPVLALDLARSTVHLALIRYVAIATPAVPLLFAGVGWAIDRRLAYACAVTSTAVGAIYLISRNIMPIDSPDLSPISRVIAAHASPGEAIVTYEPPSREWMSDVWMMTCSHEPGLFPRTVAELTEPMSPAMAQELNAPSLWLICRSLDQPMEVVIPGAKVIGTYGGVPGVTVFHVSLSNP